MVMTSDNYPEEPPGRVDMAAVVLHMARQDARSRRAAARPRTKGRETARRRTNKAPVLLARALMELIENRAVWSVSPRVVTLWKECNPGLDGRAVITHVDETRGILDLRTYSIAWATQLRLIAPMLVKRFNEAARASDAGIRPVRSIRVYGPALPDGLDRPGTHRQHDCELPYALRPPRTGLTADTAFADALDRQSRAVPHETPVTADDACPATMPTISAHARALLRARQEKSRSSGR
ncbi:hypothetical protein ACFC36_19560 [Streptomyces rubiginosohelvolus]|uniref:hypothetical protein n=1 Tax=Streptomyces rubiginosohelvolus TaxID=67362 RepID=UPI0035D71AC1